MHSTLTINIKINIIININTNINLNPNRWIKKRHLLEDRVYYEHSETGETNWEQPGTPLTLTITLTLTLTLP